MSSSIEYFNKNGYVILKDALPQEDCNYLVEHMFKLEKENKLTKDSQCPLSDAVYGDPIFDDLLEKFATPIGNSIGKNLLPTYSYSRIYRPGEVLKRHTDRESCEISATITLGYNAKKVWPIYFDDQKEICVELEPGELAVYKGCEVVHWRSAFKGNWHVQVFLHYVDANGPNKHLALDGREKLGVDKTGSRVTPSNTQTQIQTQKDNKNKDREINIEKPIFNTVTIPNGDRTFPGYFCIDKNNLPDLRFTKKECEDIIALSKDAYPSTASVGGSKDTSAVHRQIRSAKIYILENNQEHQWIYDKIATIVSVANRIHFDYEISGIVHGLQLIHYDNENDDFPGHYDWHVDSGPGDVACRKISFTAQLSNPADYEECELVINNHGNVVVGTKEQGSVHLFPSYMVHKVSPIKSGNRYALVIWIHGSRRFR